MLFIKTPITTHIFSNFIGCLIEGMSQFFQNKCIKGFQNMECLCCFNLFPSGNMTSNDRVKLQFGFWQNMPNPPHNLDKFHQTDMRGHLPNRACM